MLRALILATLLAVLPNVASAQDLGVLHVKVLLVDAEQKLVPVPRHALLISDNPATAPPRRVVTALDGTATVRLRPGNYTVESDRPVVFGGKAYQWTQIVEIDAGREATLELTADNAEVEAAAPAAMTTTPAAPLQNDPSFLLTQWQASIVTLWTPTARASGFVVDTRGLVATSQRVIGNAALVEVQLTPTVKVAGRVVAADAARDVAILWIDAKIAASVRPVPLACGAATTSTGVDGQPVFTIGAPLRGQSSLEYGTVSRVGASLRADFRLAPASTGGPVFTAEGGVVGLTSLLDEADERRRVDARVVPRDAVCDVLRSADQKLPGIRPPAATLLPVEPSRLFSREALEEAASRLATNVMAPQFSTSDFDITLITPVLAQAAQQRSDRTVGRERPGSSGSADAAQARRRLLTDFANWSEYVADRPPVLLVRATPRLKEGFWTMVGRAAAMTQGVALPPFKRFTSGFSRMRAFCGTAEVTPIHPFTLEQRVSESDVILEGLYVFDPGALGPHCGTVTLVLYSEKEPEKGDSRVVDPKLIQQVWDDFASYRANTVAHGDIRLSPAA